MLQYLIYLSSLYSLCFKNIKLHILMLLMCTINSIIRKIAITIVEVKVYICKLANQQSTLLIYYNITTHVLINNL